MIDKERERVLSTMPPGRFLQVGNLQGGPFLTTQRATPSSLISPSHRLPNPHRGLPSGYKCLEDIGLKKKKARLGKNTCLPPSPSGIRCGGLRHATHSSEVSRAETTDFRKKTVTSGGKELPREEDRTPSGGRRFEQTLPALSAGTDVALRGRDLGTPCPRGPQSLSGVPVGQQAQATLWAHGLPFRVLWLTSGNHPSWQWGTPELLRSVAERLIWKWLGKQSRWGGDQTPAREPWK